MHTTRFVAAAVTSALIAVLAPAAAFAATSGVECGLISGYAAPDPLGPTDGSIAFGLSGPTETILATASIDPVVEANLPSQVGGTITCLDVTANGSGDITGLAYASGGTISGAVTFDVGLDAYIVADRVYVPSFVVAAEPGLQAIIQAPSDAGVTLTLVVTIDPTDGNAATFDTSSQVDGSVAFSGGGDLLIGGATIPAAFVTGNALLALQFAETVGSDADVDIAGDVDSSAGTFDVSLGVVSVGCATVDARDGAGITLDGVTFPLGGGSTAAASLTDGVEAGVRVQVDTDGTLTIIEVSVPGCGSVAPVEPPATDSDTDNAAPIGAIRDFSNVALAVGLVAAWIGALVALRRRPDRFSR